MDKPVEVNISNRHAHLLEEDLYVLFGEGAKLEIRNLLAPPEKYEDPKNSADYASTRTVTVVGPKGKVEGIRVLGPPRKYTQVEFLKGDCYKLGMDIPVLLSGHLDDAAEITIVGDKGQITRKAGIIAARHIHISPAIAEEYGVEHLQKISVETPGERSVVFRNVVVNVNPLADLIMHIDTEEANAANLSAGAVCNILG